MVCTQGDYTTLREDRDKEIALADADLQKQLTGNDSAHTIAVNNTNNLHSTATGNAEAACKSAEQAALTQLNSTLAQATKDKEASIAGAERLYDQVVASLDAQYGSASSNGDTGVEGATRRSAIATRDAQYYAARDTSWANTLSGSTTLGTSPWSVKAITAANAQAAYSTSRASAQAAHDAAMLDAIEDWQLSSRESLTDLLFTEGQSRETYNVATSNVYANWEHGVGNLLGDKPEGTGWGVSGKNREEAAPQPPKKNEPIPVIQDELVTADETVPQDDGLERPDIDEIELSKELQDAISEYNQLFDQGLDKIGNREITDGQLEALLHGIPGLQVYRSDDIVIVTIDDHQFVFVYESRTEVIEDAAPTGGEMSYTPTRTIWFWSFKGMVYEYKTKTLLEHHENDKTLRYLQGKEIALTAALNMVPFGSLSDAIASGELKDAGDFVEQGVYLAGDTLLVAGFVLRGGKYVKVIYKASIAVDAAGATVAAHSAYSNMQQGKSWAGQGGEFMLRLASLGLGINSLRLSSAKDKIGKAASEAQAIEKVAENAPRRAVTGMDTHNPISSLAELQYDAIRALRRSDIDAVARNTGLSVEEVTTIKKHLFFGKHKRFDTGAGKVIRKRFDAQDDIAEAWIRAQNGPLNARQQKWFRELADHELAERAMMGQGMPFQDLSAWQRVNGEWVHVYREGLQGAHELAPRPPKFWPFWD